MARTGDPIPVDQTRTTIRSSRDRAVSALLIFSLRSREWPGARIDHNFANIFSRLAGCVNKQLKSPHGCRASRPEAPGPPARTPAWPAWGPGKIRVPGRRWAQVPDHRYPLMINGVPVVEAPEEIDICNAEQLRI